MRAGAATGSMLRRYAPFLLVVLAQGVLVATVPSSGRSTNALETGYPSAATAGATGAAGAGGASPAGTPGGTGALAEAGTEAPGAVAASGGTGPAPGAESALPPGASPGDTSHCTSDGRQQGVTSFSAPCVPVFTGDNGGTTARGVDATTIRAVLVRNTYGPAVDASLRAVGLAASPEEEGDTMVDFAEFFNRRYEQYGREIQWSFHYASCDMSTSTDCARQEARRIVQQYDPFMVVTPLTVLAEYFDQLAKEGVVGVGGWHFTDAFAERLRPYYYDWMPSGTRIARNLASYWCTRMAGRDASLAGDPLLRSQNRRLGILHPSTAEPQAVAQQLVEFAEEGCGGTADPPTRYESSGNISRAQEELPGIISRMRSDDVTTVVCLCDPITPAFLTSAATQQGFFPEHLISGMGAADHDYFGRLYDQQQWRNAFGPGIQPAPVPIEQQDDYLAYQDVGAEYRCYACLANFQWMHLSAILVHAAGPNLNAATVEAGAQSLPPIGGFEQTGNPLVPLVHFGAGQYTALNDSMHVYWDPAATSEIDGRPGSYVCVEPGCRRFPIGQWPAGEARQPT